MKTNINGRPYKLHTKLIRQSEQTFYAIHFSFTSFTNKVPLLHRIMNTPLYSKITKQNLNINRTINFLTVNLVDALKIHTFPKYIGICLPKLNRWFRCMIVSN